MHIQFFDWLQKREGYTITQLSDDDIAAKRDAENYAHNNPGLEPSGRRGMEHIFYDSKEGKYYDRRKDMFLSNDEAQQLGLMS